jgi:tetratricopeptide (TPR) repeat protein
LSAIAALLAGRPDQSDALTDPRLDGTDEVALWRAVRQAVQDEGSPRAAATFAATAPLVFEYPEPIRQRILPLIAETMIEGGEIEPAARLLNQRKDDPKLAYARALLSDAAGDHDQALTLLDKLAKGRDQFDRARAAARAIEMRLTMGTLNKTQAADALDKLQYAWRGDSRELALRERVAELRGQTGLWRTALSILRQAGADFPGQSGSVRDRLKNTLTSMIRDEEVQQMPPIEFVAAVAENTDLLSGSQDDEAIEQALADRLLALDLPDRAKPVLEKLMNQATSATAKARFGVSVATLNAREGDNAGAISALDASEGPDLPADLIEQRLILRAVTVAGLGDSAGAAAMLASTRTIQATQTRAQILENASDWTAAEQAWSDCAALTVCRHRHTGRSPNAYHSSSRDGDCARRRRREACKIARSVWSAHRRQSAGRHVQPADCGANPHHRRYRALATRGEPGGITARRPESRQAGRGDPLISDFRAGATRIL